MDPATIELMHDHVRTIVRAATGSEPAQSEPPPTPADAPPDSEIHWHFAQLEALARRNPFVRDRVPPFSFSPAVNIIDDGADLLVEIAAPGVEAPDVHVRVDLADQELRVSGIRRGESLSNGRSYLHAEIPRGPFSRVIGLPCTVDPEAHVDVRNGEIVVLLRKR